VSGTKNYTGTNHHNRARRWPLTATGSRFTVPSEVSSTNGNFRYLEEHSVSATLQTLYGQSGRPLVVQILVISKRLDAVRR